MRDGQNAAQHDEQGKHPGKNRAVYEKFRHGVVRLIDS
jgi:hypothetical protein